MNRATQSIINLLVWLHGLLQVLSFLFSRFLFCRIIFRTSRDWMRHHWHRSWDWRRTKHRPRVYLYLSWIRKDFLFT